MFTANQETNEVTIYVPDERGVLMPYVTFDVSRPEVQAALIKLGWKPPASPAPEWIEETARTMGDGGSVTH